MGELKVRIKPDNLSEVTAQIKKWFQQTWKDIEDNIGKRWKEEAKWIEKAFLRLRGVLASVFAVGAVFAFWKKLLWLWSDVEEFESKFRTVFKWVEDQAFQTFETMGDAVGRSRTDLIKYAGTVGDVLKPLWFMADQALVLSENMIKLAIDVASFNNVSDTQAIDAFTKALTWERESLKSLGIVISEADVKQKAYELWLAKTWEELWKQAKALATYQLLLDNTSDAQGDAVRTADWRANQLKRVQGIINDTFAKAGRQIAKEWASTLKVVGNFLQIYWESIFGLLVELGKSIWSFFSSIWQAIGSVMEAMWVEMGTGEDRVKTFGNVLLVILHGLNVGIRSFGILLGGIVKVVAWAVQDRVNIFKTWWQIIASTFNFVVDAVTLAFQAIPNNALAYIQQAVNNIIDHVNGLVQKLENLVGRDLFGEIGNVGSTNIINLWAQISDMFDWLRVDGAIALEGLSTNTADALEGIKDDFLDLGAYSITQMDKIWEKTVENAQKWGEAYDTSFASAKDLMADFGDLWWSAGEKTAKGAGKAKDAMEELQDSIKDAEKSMEDMEKAQERAQKAQEKYADESKEYFEDLKKEIQDVNEELRVNQEEFAKAREEASKEYSDDKIKSTTDFIISEAEAQVDKEKEIQEIKEDIAKERAEEEQDVEKIAELTKDLVEAEKELLDIKKNIADLNEWWEVDLTSTLESARARAELSDAWKRWFDFKSEQEEKLRAFQEEEAIRAKEFEAEQERLEKRKRIFDIFQNYQFKSVEELEALKAEKRLEELSVEEQQLIQQLANERIEILQLRDDKIQAERDLAKAQIDLQNRVYAIAQQNLTKLDADYTALIAKINQAVSAQQRLNSAKASQRYKGWPVTAGTPYLVGENPDWSINNKTTELFVPWASWSVVPASQVQQALKQIQNIDNSRKADISGTVIVNRDMDFLLLMERAFFRS